MYPEKIQILTLIPNKWSQEYASKQFDESEYSIRTAHELKVGGILAKPAPHKGKTLPQETLDLVQSFYEDNEYSPQMPGKKDYVYIGLNVHKQKQLVLCNLSELYSALGGKYPNIKIRFSKFCTLRPKWCVLAGSSGTHSVCVCSNHENAVLLVDAIDWEYTYKDLIKKVVCDPDNKICMMHHCESCPESAALKKFLNDELSHLDMDSEFHYCQWQTTDRAALARLTTTFKEYKGTPHRQHQQPYLTLIPDENPSKIRGIKEGICRCERGYSARGLHRELPASDPGQDAKLALEQRVLHIASPSHLLQRC